MAYLVEITRRAERDLSQLYDRINAQQSDSARKWYLGLRQRILTLERYPKRCPVTRVRGKLRQLLYGRKHWQYRVIYRVFEKQRRVEILHVRTGARRDPRRSDLFSPLYL